MSTYEISTRTSCPGLDVADRLREDVRPLLFQQRGGLALGQRLLVDLPGLGTTLDLAFDPPLAQHHRHLVDRRLMGQRKDVGGLDPPIGRVIEGLRHPHTGHEARDLGLDVGVFQRAFDQLAAFPGDP